MKSVTIVPLGMLLFVSLGCGMLGKFTDKNAGSGNANSSPAPDAAPSSTAAPASSATPVVGNSLQDKTNLLAFASGTTFAKKPAEYYVDGASNWSAIALIDEVSEYGWAKKIENGKVGESMVLEMAERSLLKTLSFDNEDTDPDAGAKNITVEISDTSANDGFVEVLATELKDKTDNQVFELAKEVPGRWVRINVKTNYGSAEYTEIMEIRGYGEQLVVTALPNVSGTYKMEQYGPMHIRQDGTSIVGCYEYSEGLIEGGVENRVMRLTWSEKDSDGRHGGPAVINFSQDGKKLTGVYSRDDSKGFVGVWNGEKISSDVGGCPHAPNLGKGNAARDSISKDLKDTGRATVYGINFDFNSDVIRAESRPTLDQIVAILKENADWKMLVEGHTDSVGGEAYNLTLSEKRAKSVKAYLVSAGINESRLSSAGLGMTKPVADNKTEFGRAQNRRVELLKQ